MSKLRNLKVHLENFTLHIDELVIPDEGVTAICGPSGSGKTTLLNVLVGIVEATGWSWEFKGTDLAGLTPADRRIGVVFQTYDLFPHMTAEENIMIVARARYSGRDVFEKKKSEIEYMKERLNLHKCWHTRAEKLSGGEKQRVAFLRAVFSDPRVIILDEPFSALDENLRNESRQILKSVIQDLNVPVLLITHDQKDVDELSRNKIQLENGQIKNKI